MIKARDVMTQSVYTVFPDTPVLHAARLLVEKHVSGLPVVDEERNLLGIISEKDLLELLLDITLENKKVEDVMTRDVISFKPDDSLIWICKFLMHHNIRRVPIADHGKLVGVISRRDIMAQILRRK